MSRIHVTGSEILGGMYIDYFVRTHDLCFLNTPVNFLHTFGVQKTGQAGNTPTCVVNTHDIFSVNKLSMRNDH